ncbi:unnamed protein product [Rhizoctonia solani]|uniref:Uncharacterized protein n=1 Tax=Rhizoctonia solani TaxID=456999 RepID=A0A8H3C0T0_9AGAM|nr:unnamed protein product [Rhizoctonia solani]
MLTTPSYINYDPLIPKVAFLQPPDAHGAVRSFTAAERGEYLGPGKFPEYRGRIRLNSSICGYAKSANNNNTH